MLVLAIDTSGECASVTLATEQGMVSEIAFRHRMDLLQRLIPNVDRLVADAGKSKSEIDGVIISLGPGSFTGLRIGMAAAKSIAHVLDRPIAGIPTLDVLARGAAAACPGSIAAAVDARPGEVFWAIYRCEAGVPKRLADDQVSPIDEMIQAARGENGIVFCGDGARRNRDVLAEHFGPQALLDEWFNIPRGTVLASLGIQRLSRGDSDDLFSLVPRYVRRPTPVVRLETGQWE